MPLVCMLLFVRVWSVRERVKRQEECGNVQDFPATAITVYVGIQSLEGDNCVFSGVCTYSCKVRYDDLPFAVFTDWQVVLLWFQEI